MCDVGQIDIDIRRSKRGSVASPTSDELSFLQENETKRSKRLMAVAILAEFQDTGLPAASSSRVDDLELKKGMLLQAEEPQRLPDS